MHCYKFLVSCYDHTYLHNFLHWQFKFKLILASPVSVLKKERKYGVDVS